MLTQAMPSPSTRKFPHNPTEHSRCQFLYGIVTETRMSSPWHQDGKMRACKQENTNIKIIRGESSHANLSLLGVLENLLRGALDNTTSHGKVGALLEVEIDLASSHAAFIDTPDKNISLSRGNIVWEE